MPSGEPTQRIQVLTRLIERATAMERTLGIIALAAGVLSLCNSALTIVALRSGGDRVLGIDFFVLSWSAVLLLSAGFGLVMLRRPPARIWTTELAEAVRCVFPAFATAVGATVLFFWNGAAFSLAIVWIICYGLALLATRMFAPASIVMLGSTFLMTGISLMLFVHLRIILLIGYSRSDVQTALMMGATFGLYHLIFGLMILYRTRPISRRT